MRMPTITLTTDFGTRDGYVAQMKGVLLSRGPDGLSLVDLSHDLPAQGVRETAFFLRQAVPRFAAGTVHLAVVDPGVGSARRAIAVALGGQFLVGPDNGIFGWLYDGDERAVTLDPAALGIEKLSATFHGRDLFAPAAAALAGGAALASLGPAASELVRLPWPEPAHEPDLVHGEVIHVDRFGNLISNVRGRDLARLGGGGAPLAVLLSDHVVGPIREHYAEVPRGQLIALIGSEGLLEVAARDGDAARIAGAEPGTPIRVTTGEVAAMVLDGELDLHAFRPAEVADVVEEYVKACHREGLRELRIVHGKGKGALRRTVHAVLDRLEEVERFRLAPAERGGWGATLVDLR